MSLRRLVTTLSLVCPALFLASPALAHITFAVPQAPIGANYKAVLRVPHGCQGAATVRLRVQIPSGVIGVKPQPKAGWQLKVVKGDYDEPETLYGTQLTSGVREIDWSEGHLPDAFYDEFVFRAYLSDRLQPGAQVYFPVVQECEKGTVRWIDTPDEMAPEHGHDHGDDPHADTPAPSLTLLPKKAHSH